MLDYVVTAENCSELPELEQYMQSIGFKVKNGYVKHLDKPFDQEKVTDVIVRANIEPFIGKINNADIIALNTGVTELTYTVYGIYLVTGQRIPLTNNVLWPLKKAITRCAKTKKCGSFEFLWLFSLSIKPIFTIFIGTMINFRANFSPKLSSTNLIYDV